MIFIAAQKFEGLFRGREYLQKHNYPFPVVFDESREVTHAYGVYQALGIDAINIARRATFVLGGEGKICWIFVSNHQLEAPRLEDIFKAIEACGKY